MKKCLLLLTALGCGILSFGQVFSIKTVELTADQVIVHYDLLDTTKSRTYTVFVYSSQDNYLSPLTKLTGDHGIGVRPGQNRKVAWNAKEELGDTFDGEVELEIRGRMYVPFIQFEGFEDVQVRKRKSPFLVKWSGGTRNNILNFQLYQKSEKGDRLAHTFPNAPNEFEYRLEIPASVKPGGGYYFRISDTKNRDQVVITPDFGIKRKYPLVWTALPVAAAGVGIYFLLTRDKDDFLDPAPDPPNEQN